MVMLFAAKCVSKIGGTYIAFSGFSPAGNFKHVKLFDGDLGLSYLTRITN
jgi:hypothetical protein